MKPAKNLLLATVLVTSAAAHAQPAPGDPAPEPPAPSEPPPGPPPPVVRRIVPRAQPRPVPPPVVDRSAIALPEILRNPTGWLLPAAVLYSTTSIDTGGGVASDNRVGLGDVAELGVATTDRVREHTTAADKSTRIQPYVVASFRLGISESRLFEAQPGVTLGFRKSFERSHDGFKSQIAELTLVASKHLGPRAALHLGGAIWDASLQSIDPAGPIPTEITLHGHGYGRQVRAFGGVEVEPLDHSSILVDLSWAPELCYECADRDKIGLRPELSWGVRYQVARFMYLESGVRVPDIGNFNLLDAQIFGQLTLTSSALRAAVADRGLLPGGSAGEARRGLIDSIK
jgi:hypothetical protein